MSAATLERGLQAFREQMDSRIASFFDSCVHCGICAQACLFYTETQDPKYTPIYKLEIYRRFWEQEYTVIGRLKKLLGLSKAITDEELEEWKGLLYNGCTMCGRCSVFCPVGNDIVYMIRRAREGFAASGHAPEGLINANTRTIATGSPMGVRLPALQAQMKHVQEETGLEVPIDKMGAEYLVILSSMEIINFPEYLAAITKIFRHAGKTWTLCSEAFEATNSGIQIGASDIARELVQRIINAAEKLKVKTVISPECGHAYTAIRWEAPNLIRRPLTFRVQHILEVLEDLRLQGKLKTQGFEETRLTFHDPCQLVRQGGVLDPPRNLLRTVAKNFVDMSDHGKFNWCCGGGGGVSAVEEAEELRLTAFKRKKAQIESLGVETLVTACANCRVVIEEGIDHYGMDLPVLGLTEMIAERLVENNSDNSASARGEN